MRLIGLTGRSGSGKSTVGAVAASMGFLVLDCDRIYAEITSRPTPCLEAIRDTFGEETVKEGKLCRPALREKVFSDPAAMAKLNALTARYMGEEISLRLDASTASVALLDAPTLFQSGLDGICDYIIVVVASEEECVRRIVSRDGISPEDALRRLAQQPSADFYRAHCNVCLENTDTEETFREKAEMLLKQLQKGEL